MVTLDEEAGRAPTTPLLVGVRHSTGLSDSKGLTSSKYGAAEVDRTTAKVPAESSHSSTNTSRGGPVYYVIYALVNSIMCIPCLYGYASVIFNNNVFSPHINALSKLVLWSSTVHQFSFTIFSSLPFSIGQVQDAGLIFLSQMANTIANELTDQHATTEEILSTTLVLLSLATASLGVICIIMGKFKLADAVSYLPLPVVGGYLAFIGYFCVQAGISLCISKPMIGLAGWASLWSYEAIILSIPGLAAGAFLVWVARKVEHDVALPLAMVCIPAGFYLLLFLLGGSLEGAREGGWVGEVAPPVPVTDLFTLVDITKVHWVLVMRCLSTWLGMVLVVSFSSCLDVAAISMDMGEALEVNTELTTVGISNLASGLTIGFTGSYIFSQTIFTCRTRTNSRWVGFLVACSFLGVIVSTVNVLEVTPLFFLGSTLIFIGTDLLYEWIIEIRHKLLWSEYVILLATFICIQILGINAGIVFGVILAVVDYVFTTARTSSMTRVAKHSRAMWTAEQWKLLHNTGYAIQNPKIVTLEITGTVFFGSSVRLLSCIVDEIALNASANDMEMLSMASPRRNRANASPARRHLPRSPLSLNLRSLKVERGQVNRDDPERSVLEYRPRFVVLNLFLVPNMDSSAARGCFLQLAKMCARNNVLLCASGASARIDWILRSHKIAYAVDEEEKVKKRIRTGLRPDDMHDKILLFDTLYEALEFCEYMLLSELNARSPKYRYAPHLEPNQGLLLPRTLALSTARSGQWSVSKVFTTLLGSDHIDDSILLQAFEESDGAFHDEKEYSSGESIFERGTHSDAFFVVLSGSVCLFYASHSHTLAKGGVFGFVDFIMEKQWSFNAVAVEDGTIVAKFHRDGLARVKAEDPALDRIVDKFLLQASIRELSNVSEL